MEKRLQLLLYIKNAQFEYVTAGELSMAMGRSTRTVLRYIRELTPLGPENGFRLTAHRGKGFALRIDDGDRFARFLANHSAGGAGGGDPVLTAAACLLTRDPVKLEELAETLNYSRSSLSRIMRSVEELLGTYGLEIDTRPHQGMRVRGGERALRSAMVALLFGDGEAGGRQPFGPDPEALAGEIRAAAGRDVGDRYVRLFAGYLTVTLRRWGEGHSLAFPPAEGMPPALVPQRREPLEGLFRAVGAGKLPEGERNYLAVAWEQLLGPVADLEARYVRDRAYYDGIVRGALEKIQHNYRADFTRDENLPDSLSRHIAVSFGGYLLGIAETNPHAETARSEYPVAHYYAIDLAGEITARTGLALSEGSLGYLTLHFASAMEQTVDDNRVRVAVVRGQAVGEANLLASRLTRRYPGLELIGIYDLYEAERLKLLADVYVTPAPLEAGALNDRPLLRLSPFLDAGDAALLDRFLSRGRVPMESVFRREHFFVLERPGRKDAVLEYLCDALMGRGCIGPADKEALFAREALAATDIAPGVVMAHCLIGGPSFLCFAVLDTPVRWGKGHAGLVLLGFFQKGDSKLKPLLRQIYGVLGGGEGVDALRACRQYDGFLKRLNELIGGDKRDKRHD